MAKDAFYFSHDYNARQDEKIRQLIRKHGMTGYGIFWAIIEDLYNNANALRTDYEGIAFDMRVDENVIFSIVNDFGLFVISGNFFGSLSVERRLNERAEKSKKASESASYRWKKVESDANALRTQSDSNAIKERKENENKVNEIKKDVNIYRAFKHLSITVEQVEKLKNDYYQSQIDDILDAIENRADNKKYTSLYFTAKNWLRKEPKKVQVRKL